MILETIDDRLLKKLTTKLRSYRHRRNIKMTYLIERANYYAHATTLIPDDQNALVSIVVPCFNTPEKYLEPLLSSVYSQGYENWELILVDASSGEEKSHYIAKKANSDSRIRYVRTENKGIAINTNVGLGVAKGKYIAFMDHDDTLDHDALAESVCVLEDNADYGIVYSDEDKISDSGDSYFDPHFKPGFSLDMLRNVNYITHFVVAKKTLVDQLEGIRSGFDGAQDYDFLLRAVDTGTKIAHIPKILYHWRVADGSTAADFSNKQNILDAGCRALDDHYKRNGIKNVKNKAIEGRPGFYRPVYKPSSNTKRAIRIDIKKYPLTDMEYRYIINSIKNNNDVVKYKIAVEDAKEVSNEKYDTVFTISAPISPIGKKADIISMFEIAEEPGVYRVSPKISRHGKILNMGTVKTDNGEVRLFENVSVDRNDFFGSLEWVHNVDECSEVAYIQNKKNTSQKGRNIVWPHSKFTSYNLPRNTEAWSRNDLEGLYNRNITKTSSTTIKIVDYVSDFVEEVQ